MWVKRKKLILAFLGSVAIHLVLLVLFAVIVELQPPAQAVHPDEPIRLQIVPENKPPEPLALATPPPARKRYSLTDRAETEPPPEETQVVSNIDSLARSELAPDGSAPLPAQNGKKAPVFGFDTHEYAAAVSPQAPPTPGTPAPETAPPLPQPDTRAARPADTPPPTPAPVPAPTAAPDEFAMAEPTPTPTPAPDFDPFVRAPQTEPPGPTPVAAMHRPARTLTAEEKTLIRGDLSNRGPSSLAAKASPQGRYSKAISDAISVRWRARMSQQMDLASFGTVKIHFIVDPRGKVIEPHVISNSGNDALASISLEAIMEASIPPVPPEVAAVNDRTGVPLDFDFSLY